MSIINIILIIAYFGGGVLIGSLGWKHPKLKHKTPVIVLQIIIGSILWPLVVIYSILLESK